ncbi:hypothetical protein ACQV2C_00285 [Pantoea allii]|uniref:hypothetical protein n=1 Tax=Pantoea allii TaxID=574096 RepID=UPI003D31967E
MTFMEKLLVCNVVLLCTLASAHAYDVPQIHSNESFAMTDNRGTLATIDSSGAVRQASVNAEDMSETKKQVQSLIKMQENQTDTLNTLSQKLSKNEDVINNLQRSLDEANRKISDQQRALEQVSSKIK